MTFDAHANFVAAVVAIAPNPPLTATSLTLSTGQGSLLPTPPFNAIVWATRVQPATTNAEIVRVTGVATDTLTIVRHQEGSTARQIVAGDQFVAGITAKTIQDIEAAIPSAGAYQSLAQKDVAGGYAGLDGSAKLAVAELPNSPTFVAGVGQFGHAPPSSQPTTPITLSDVIALLQSYGMSA